VHIKAKGIQGDVEKISARVLAGVSMGAERQGGVEMTSAT
jgi:hypothetical protein